MTLPFNSARSIGNWWRAIIRSNRMSFRKDGSLSGVDARSRSIHPCNSSSAMPRAAASSVGPIFQPPLDCLQATQHDRLGYQ
jgi:hypothetical protein